MVRFRIAELLTQAGKTKYWLYRQLGMSYQSFMRLYRNETRSIKMCIRDRCEGTHVLNDGTGNRVFVEVALDSLNGVNAVWNV